MYACVYITFRSIETLSSCRYETLISCLSMCAGDCLALFSPVPACLYACDCIYVCMCACIYVCVYVNGNAPFFAVFTVSLQVPAYACIKNAYMNTYIQCMHPCMYVYARINAQVRMSIHTYIRICMHAYLHTYVNTNIHAYTGMGARTRMHHEASVEGYSPASRRTFAVYAHNCSNILHAYVPIPTLQYVCEPIYMYVALTMYANILPNVLHGCLSMLTYML
jgi:hypothetical protein